MSDIPRASFRVNELLRQYREMAGLSQNELAALSVALCEANLIDRSFTQSALARWERPPDDGASPRMRVEKLRDDSLAALAGLLEHALKRRGFDGADAADLEMHLRRANSRRVDPRSVSTFALEVDALLAPLPRWVQHIAQQWIREGLLMTQQIVRLQIARQREAAEQRAITRSGDNSADS